MDESTKERTEGRLEAFAAAAGEGAGKYVENAGTGSGGKKERGGEEEHEAVSVEHNGESINVEEYEGTSAEHFSPGGLASGL